MRFPLLVSLALFASACLEPVEEISGSAFHELTPFQAFSAAPVDAVSSGDALFTLVRVRRMLGADAKLELTRFDANGQAALTPALQLPDEPFFTGRLALGPDGRLWMSELQERVGEVGGQVVFKALDPSSGEELARRQLRTQVFSVNAIHVDARGTLWCFALSPEFQLTLFRVAETGEVTAIPVASRIVRDVEGELVAWSSGVRVLTRLEANRAEDFARFGMDTPKRQGALGLLLTYDFEGKLVHAKSVAPELNVQPEVLVARGSWLLAAGVAKSSLDDDSLFISRWRVGEDGALEEPQLRTVRLSEKQHLVSSAAILEDGSLVIGGEVGISQAKTGSVVEGGRAFVTRVSADLTFGKRSFIGDDSRRNQVATLSFVEEKLLGLVYLDGPKTHDADVDPAGGYSSTRLFEIRPEVLRE